MKTTDKLDDVYTLQCVDIWGGIEPVERNIATPGLCGWVFSQPYQGHANGGDIYFVSLCAHGTVTRVVVADVSGHGQTVADLAGTLRELLDRYMNTADQTRLVRAVNTEFARLAQDNHFATAVVATHFADDGSVILCNAGHPRPLWYSSTDGIWTVLDPNAADTVSEVRDLPLGVIEDTGYTQYAVTLGPDDRLVLYTDALIEARSLDGQLLGEQGLIRLAGSIQWEAPEQFGRQLLAGVASHTQTTRINDDATLMALCRNGREG